MGEAATNLEDIDVDALLAEARAPAEERAMEGPKEAPAPAAEATPWWSTIEFDSGGRKVKPDSEEKARTWISQGYDYSQKMGAFNQERAKWQAERQELSGYKDKFSRYDQVDQYAAKNPDWWKHVQESWNSRDTVGVDPQIAKVLSPIQEKLSQFEQFVGTIQQQQQAAEAAKQQEALEKDNQALDQEITSIRKQYPNIDLATKDESGETLERRILKHAMDINTSSFRAAFRDYLHDQLLVTAKADGKDAVAKETQLNFKKGLLGKTQTPTKELKPVNTKAPWNDKQFSGANILKEMGFG